MTTALYVTSTERFSGKTALCMGLVHWLRRKGLSTGYMKPVSTTARMIGEGVADEDAIFLKSALDLPDPLGTIVPIILTEKEAETLLDGADKSRLESDAFRAFREVSANREAIVMEGGTNLREGFIINLQPRRLAELLGARALVVVPYIDMLQIVDDLLAAQSILGESLLGAVINRIPQHRVVLVKEKIKPFVENRGIRILGMLQREKALLSVSVRELLEGLGGEILCCATAVEELVENLMVGAMGVEGALTYFRRAPNKAVVTGGDRPDIQLAALETSTRCLILTGNLRPSPLIIGLAEERGIPIILTRLDTLKTVEIVETFFGKTRFHQQKKVQYFEKLLEKSMDFEAMSRALDI